LTTFDRVREDETLAALKAAVAEIEARRATAKYSHLGSRPLSPTT
jgi:hypothetical protein